MIGEKLRAALQALGDQAKAEGVSFVGVLAHYTATDAHFSTRLSLTAVPEAGVSEDHVVLDAVRQISEEWTEVTHA